MPKLHEILIFPKSNKYEWAAHLKPHHPWTILGGKAFGIDWSQSTEQRVPPLTLAIM